MQSIEYMAAALAVFTIFIVAVSSLTGIIVNSLNYSSQQNVQSYAQTILENMLTSTGSPSNWGVSFTNPTSFGLAETGSTAYQLDANKLLRLASTYPFAVSYSYAQHSLGASNYHFRLSFVQPMNAAVSIQKNVAINTITLVVQVTDTQGKPVPLATVSANALMYLNFTTNLGNNHGSYVSQSTHYGWLLFTQTDASSNVTFNVASVQASAPTNELGQVPFAVNLTAVTGQTNMVNNVPVIVIVGKVTLANIQVPFGYWTAANGINLHVFGTTDVQGWTLKDNSVTPAKYYLIIYGPANSTLWRTAINGSNPNIQVVISTPTGTALATIYQATSWTAQNGQAVQVPLLASGAPIQSLFTFNTKGNGDTITFEDILIFVDPLLLLGTNGRSQPLTFGENLISPSTSPTAVRLQRFVLVEGFSYIVQFTLWR